MDVAGLERALVAELDTETSNWRSPQTLMEEGSSVINELRVLSSITKVTLSQSHPRDFLNSMTELHPSLSISMDSLLRLAALVNCGLGVSVLEWSKSKFQPMAVEFRDKLFLALVPHSALMRESRFYLIKAESFRDTIVSERRVLIAMHFMYERFATMCLFPPEVKWK